MAAVGRAGAMVIPARDRRRRDKKRRRQQVADELADEDLGFNPTHTRFSVFFRRLKDSSTFQWSIIAIVCVAAAQVGVNTYKVKDPFITRLLALMEELIVGIFLGEVCVKIFAEGKRPFEYWRDGWNVLDFIVVVLSLLPIQGGDAVTGLRLIRLLRVLKLVRALPELRILVMGLLKSLSSIGYIGILLMLIFYLYAVLGVSQFRVNDPQHFGSLHVAMLTLFRVATLEDWVEIMFTQVYGCGEFEYIGDNCTDPQPQEVVGALYFCTFVILSSLCILNLFIGVILSSMDDARVDLMEEMHLQQRQKKMIEERLAEERRMRSGSATPSGSRTNGGDSPQIAHQGRLGTTFVEQSKENDEDKRNLEEFGETVDRLWVLHTMMGLLEDEVAHLKKVELDKWVRREETRVRENLNRIAGVKRMKAGADAFRSALRHGRMSDITVARRALNAPEKFKERAARVKRIATGEEKGTGEMEVARGAQSGQQARPTISGPSSMLQARQHALPPVKTARRGKSIFAKPAVSSLFRSQTSHRSGSQYEVDDDGAGSHVEQDVDTAVAGQAVGVAAVAEGAESAEKLSPTTRQAATSAVVANRRRRRMERRRAVQQVQDALESTEIARTESYASSYTNPGGFPSAHPQQQTPGGPRRAVTVRAAEAWYKVDSTATEAQSPTGRLPPSSGDLADSTTQGTEPTRRSGDSARANFKGHPSDPTHQSTTSQGSMSQAETVGSVEHARAKFRHFNRRERSPGASASPQDLAYQGHEPRTSAAGHMVVRVPMRAWDGDTEGSADGDTAKSSESLSATNGSSAAPLQEPPAPTRRGFRTDETGEAGSIPTPPLSASMPEVDESHSANAAQGDGADDRGGAAHQY